MRTILIQPDVKGVELFRQILQPGLIDFNVATSIEDVKPADIEVVIIWQCVPDFLFKLPNLKLILTCGSGVDHILLSQNLPHYIPNIRLVDPFLKDHVSKYVVEQIVNHLFPQITFSSDYETTSLLLKYIKRKGSKIGIMGLGLIGYSTAVNLIKLGFNVCGWVKSSKPRLLNEVYVGIDSLKAFAKNCDVLVCHLPLTPETKGILNNQLFSFLPNQAYVINVGRGAHLNESDLLHSLKIGKLSGACLDVLEVEPILLNHPFLSCPNIKLTPHIAGYVNPETQAPYCIEVINSYYKSGTIVGMVNYLSHY